MPMKYTVVRISNVDLVVLLNEEQEDYGIDQVQIGEEIGETYQQQVPDRLLIRTLEEFHQMLAFNHDRDVGPLLPTITQDLLTGDFGMTYYDIYRD